MSGAFLDVRVVRGELADVPARELALQPFDRIHVLAMRWPAGAVLDLLGPVALEQEQAAGFHGRLHAGEYLGTIVGRQELHEHRHHRVVLRGVPRPAVDVAQPMVDADAARGGQPLCLRDAIRREIERGDDGALLGEMHAVAAFAVRDAEHRLSRRDEMGMRAHEGVGRFAEVIAVACVARLPGFERVGEPGHGYLNRARMPSSCSRLE